jgi:hypothetical protein
MRKGFTKIRWKQLKKGMPPLKTSPIQNKKSQVILKKPIRPLEFQIPKNNYNMEEAFERQNGSIVAQPKGQKVIMTNQRGFYQPPNHISTTQAFHLVIITTNEHHPRFKGTTQQTKPPHQPLQPLPLPTLPLPLQQGMPIGAPTLHLPC